MLFLFARQPQTHPSEIEAKTRLNILRRRIVAACLQNDDNAWGCLPIFCLKKPNISHTLTAAQVENIENNVKIFIWNI